MPERAPTRSDNRLATGITVATLAALLLAVGLATFGVFSPPAPEKSAALPAATLGETANAAGAPTLTTVANKTPARTGEASWYDFSGEETANGETMNADRLTAAHPTLPFGTRLKVENMENGRTVIVRVNDRGPYAEDRLLDVSKEAAERLGMVEDGVTDVHVAPVPTDTVDDPGSPIE